MIEITRPMVLNATLYAVLLVLAAAAIGLGLLGHIGAGAVAAGLGFVWAAAWHVVMVLFSPALTRWCNEED